MTALCYQSLNNVNYNNSLSFNAELYAIISMEVFFMFYKIENKEILETEYSKECLPLIGYCNVSDLPCDLSISKSVIDACNNEQARFKNSVDVYEDYCFGIINIIDLFNVYDDRDRIGFILEKNRFILLKLVDSDNSVFSMVEEVIAKLQGFATFEKVVYGILEGLLFGGYEALEAIESQITVIENGMLDDKIEKSFYRTIYRLKDTLHIHKSYFRQLEEIGSSLYDDESELLSENMQKYCKIFSDRCRRLANQSLELVEELMHLREAIDAKLDYGLNEVMKVFTVITAIFLPLTLIAGWYGMNFKNIPLLEWEYGYITCVFFSLLTVVFVLYLFKKKKFL